VRQRPPCAALVSGSRRFASDHSLTVSSGGGVAARAQSPINDEVIAVIR
jgi:hypothetical protein